MANEFTRSAAFSVSKGGAAISTGTLSKTSDMAGTYMGTTTQSVGTSNEALSFNTTDITGDVHITIKNLDSANYVEIFKDSGNSHLLSKLAAGEFCQLAGVPSATLYGRANTAAVSIQFWISQV